MTEEISIRFPTLTLKTLFRLSELSEDSQAGSKSVGLEDTRCDTGEKKPQSSLVWWVASVRPFRTRAAVCSLSAIRELALATQNLNQA